MWTISDKEFKKLVEKERDANVRDRMRAMHMVFGKEKTATEVAECFLKCPKWISKWIKRFEEGGFDALRDLPCSGRPRVIQLKKIEQIIQDIHEPL